MADLLLPEPTPLEGPGEWFSERFLGLSSIGFCVTARLHEEQSAFQRIEVYQTAHHGRLLVLDGCVMLTELDEFIYHEMMAHVGGQTVGDPRRALVIGGGDGGLVGELLKYSGCEVTLAEIDERVVQVSLEHLPVVSAPLRDPRTRLAFVDGAAHLADTPQGTLDLVLVDSTDPVGPAQALVTEEFYLAARRALRPGGAFLAQTQSPFYHSAHMRRVYDDLSRVFRHVAMFWAVVPCYPGALWTFCVASDERDPLAVQPPDDVHRRLGTRYYSAGVHRGALALPPVLQACLPEGHPQRR